MSTIQELKTEDGKLKADAIKAVKIKELMSKQEIMGHQSYSERPTHYMIQLQDQNLWYRVYATPIGNVSVVYIKAGGRITYCETALEEALARAEDD
ncbi:hypothetical protein SEA_BIRDFEEDER_21 [Microbacterium phage Birdfeeder]|nr:hypothetical protein SEA_BIRDFEEDER_21 [Microbacterium phage Birdfeeder]